MIPSDILERVFDSPLDEFTSTRDAIVKELKSQGNGDVAAEVKSLRKPTVSAWAVNQLARGEADDIRRLFEIRDEMASAGNAASLRKGVDERKKLLVTLVARAEKILTEAGHAPTATTTERITQTLQAGDTDEDRDAIVEGRLSKDLTPSGFGGLGGFTGFAEESDDDAEAEEADRLETKRRVEALVTEAEIAEEEASRRSTVRRRWRALCPTTERTSGRGSSAGRSAA